MKLTCCIFTMLFLRYAIVPAQSVFNPAGAEAWGTGGSAVASQNVWAVQNNPAAFSQFKKFRAGLYSSQAFHEAKLSMAGLSMVLPAKWINTGLGIQHFGYNLFNQQKLSLSLARQLTRQFSLGITFSYFSTNISEQAHAGNMLAEAGLLYHVSSKLRLGVLMFNPTQNTYAPGSTEKIPTYARAGIGYEVSEKVRLLAEAEQVLNQQAVWRGGIRYQLHEILSLSAGMASNPVYYTFGTGIRLKAFQLDFATGIHEVLGLTPHLSVSFPTQQ